MLFFMLLIPMTLGMLVLLGLIALAGHISLFRKGPDGSSVKRT